MESKAQGKRKPNFRKCNHCYASNEDTKLFECSNCKSQLYCSKECQKRDWKIHKVICLNNSMLASLLKQQEDSALGAMQRRTLVDGVSMFELDKRLERWVKYHMTTLNGATIHGLHLPLDVFRARTHVLHVVLEPRPVSEHGNNVGKYFRVLKAEAIAIADGMRKQVPWPGSLYQLKVMAMDSERLGNGLVTAVMIECPPLDLQIVPQGSMTEESMRDAEFEPLWKESFFNFVEHGVRPKQTQKQPKGRR